jgi:rhodanese-related sulfurtransferase
MGPLIPYVFSKEFGLIMAVLIGIGFGFVLEQAGFSSTKKLVGLFYGLDFTVLRVFFTAGITAMIGVLILSDYGLLDISVIYINPTFLRSALVGGAVMGAGFIIGGFCPGTSVCAAAIGKLDAMAFIAGSFLGVFIFIEAFPLFSDFYNADAMGDVLMYTKLGMSRMTFAFVLTIVALLAFYFTWRIENNLNERAHTLNSKLKRNYILFITSPLVILVLLAILPNKQEIITHKISKTKEQQKCVFREISSDKLATEITQNYYTLNIIDIRSAEDFKSFHIPMAINIPFEEIQNRKWESYFKQRIKTNVFYADNDTLVKMACLKAKFIGKSDNVILRESAQEFQRIFFDLGPIPLHAGKEELQVYTFRSDAAKKMTDIVNSLQNMNKPVQKEIRKVSGGCS